ncbi:MAG: lysozyme inhibitor LprI family protein [Agathobaculum sp.]|jgi:hypothetical protein|uniref:lysozyme inhibitor LprI family protein n=1 Tax=Agathobaculum sp. TaxID=2048138 RepID=UPI003D936A4B
MLCKNCGKELPIAGKFCPFCGAVVEQTGVNDETTVFTTLPDDLNVPIDLSAFDAARRDSGHGAAPADEPAAPSPAQTPADEMPPVRPAAPRGQQGGQYQTPPRTTYFDAPEPERDEPYRRPSQGKRAAVIVLVIVLIAALIGGGIWFFKSRQPDENLTLAEKYLERGKFEDALAAFEAALGEAKDPAAIQLQIDQLKSYQQALSLVESGDYAAALATLNDLRGRIADKTSPLGEAVDALIEQANTAHADSEFAADLQEAQGYLDEQKLDAAAGKLDALAGDSTLTDEQQKQVDELRKKLEEAQAAADRKEENEQAHQAKKEAFRHQMDALEANDQKISSASTTEEAFDLTSSSFEAWDQLLSDMYDQLATVLNADQYAAEEDSYKQWIQERDKGAENAAASASGGQDDEDDEDGEEADPLAGQLAAASFKQSYTKTRCYKLMDMM